MQLHFLRILLAGSFLFSACNNDSATKEETSMKKPDIQTEAITYGSGKADDSLVMNGYIAWDGSREGTRPVVLVVPEWWGLNEYAKRRARELAALGYLSMAVDFYGNGQQADNPDDAGKLAGPFYANPQLAWDRFSAAYSEISKNKLADTTKVAAIGYCFGGTQVLNVANMGAALKGVVSFHGGLQVVPPAKDKLKAQVLVCHGNADPFVPNEQADQFKKQMDSVGARYTFIGYDGATHAFSNPDATENGKKFNMPIAYNPAADTASFAEMKKFLSTVFE